MSRDLLTGVWTAGQPPAIAPRDWELLLAQARSMRLEARLARLYEQPGWKESVPAHAWHQLRSATRYAEVLRRDVTQEIGHLCRALQQVDTPIVLLKGAAYVAAALPAAEGRLFSDVDILVRRDKLREVELALFAAGWIAEKLDPYDDRYYRQWMHELPPLRHVQRQSHLDVHHTLAPPTSRFVIDGAAMLARAQPVAAHGAGSGQLQVLSPVDVVLHSALHLMQDGEFHTGLRDLLDIRDLLLHFGAQPGFWPALAARSRELRLDRVLAQVLAQLRRLFHLQPPAGFDAPATSGSGRLVQTLLSAVLTPPDPDGEPPARWLARQLMYVRSHWLRMPWYQIVPHLARKAVARLTAGRQNA